MKITYADCPGIRRVSGFSGSVISVIVAGVVPIDRLPILLNRRRVKGMGLDKVTVAVEDEQDTTDTADAAMPTIYLREVAYVPVERAEIEDLQMFADPAAYGSEQLLIDSETLNFLFAEEGESIKTENPWLYSFLTGIFNQLPKKFWGDIIFLSY